MNRERQWRKLTKNEYEILRKMLSVQFVGRDTLEQQLVTCEAVPTGDNDNYGSLYLKTDSAQRAATEMRVPVEGHINDNDGADITLLLHVVDGVLNELEIFRSDGLELVRPSIEANELQVNVAE